MANDITHFLTKLSFFVLRKSRSLCHTFCPAVMGILMTMQMLPSFTIAILMLVTVRFVHVVIFVALFHVMVVGCAILNIMIMAMIVTVVVPVDMTVSMK